MSLLTSHAQVLLLIKHKDVDHPARSVLHEFLAEQEEVVHAAVSPGSRLELAAPAFEAHSVQAVLRNVDLLEGRQIEQQLAPSASSSMQGVITHVQPFQADRGLQSCWNPAAI